MRKFLAVMTLVVTVMIAAACKGPMRWDERAIGSAGPDVIASGRGWRVLEPMQDGALTIFPVVGDVNVRAMKWAYLTLDEGLRSGEVEVTEAGRVRGLVRPRHGGEVIPRTGYDQVNTLVLVNHSDKPVVLLAGEIVTGGKQDRVIGKDRIVPAGAEPIDLGVFCIEHGRWTETSAEFGVAGKAAKSFMVQPAVRAKAMAEKDQQQVWNAVADSVSGLAAAAAPAAARRSLGTTSYAKAMQNEAVVQKVDEAADRTKSAEVLEKLRRVHASGVVVAVRGQIVWADLFATPEMLAKYWPKLIRSYAAETLTSRERGGEATMKEAQHFLNASDGHETSEGERGVYRYSELRGAATDEFELEALLPGTDFDVHVSKAELSGPPTLGPAMVR